MKIWKAKDGRADNVHMVKSRIEEINNDRKRRDIGKVFRRINESRMYNVRTVISRMEGMNNGKRRDMAKFSLTIISVIGTSSSISTK